MTLGAPVVQHGQPEPESNDPARLEERAASVALSLLPGGLIVYFSFEGGGYFAGSVAFIALLLTQILLVRVLFARHPFAGCSRRQAIVAVLFAAYAAWTLCSALWSHALGRALVEFDRSLLYLLLLLLFGSLPRSTWRMPLILRGLAGGSLFVCTVSLITRVLPRLWPVSPGVANNRLSYPITYWNALGILATIAVVLLLGITSNTREHWGLRALAAGGIPIAATTLLFTFSRGAIGALVLGVLIFVVIGWSRGLPGAVIATVPTTAFGLLTAYRANLLDTLQPTTPAAVAQGHQVALVVGLMALAALIIRAALAPLERRLASAQAPFSVSRRAGRVVASALLVALVTVAVGVGGSAWISRQYRLFSQPSTVHVTDLRARLTDPSSDGRVEHWRAALKAFATKPVTGTGAGTFEFSWYRYRRYGGPVVHAHNLYVQTLSELGVVGLLLLAGVLASLLAAIGRRIRGPNRVLYATLFTAVLVWALHSAVDWDWEMPAVTAWVFAVGGAVLASGTARRGWSSGLGARVPLAVALLAIAVAPTLLMLSELHLQRAANAFETGSCAAAQRASLSSIDVLAIRPEPYQILGYCDMYERRTKDAVAAMRKAVQQEPGSWEYHFGLSIADAYAGINPRPQLAAALRLAPGDSLVEQMAPVFRTRSRARWLATARRAYVATFVRGRLTLR